MEMASLLVGLALGLLWSRVSRLDRRAPAAASSDDAPDAGAASAPTETADAAASASAAGDEGEQARRHVAGLARALGEVCDAADRGADLLQDPRFGELVARIAEPPFSTEDRGQWVTSQTTALSCAALAAMARLGEPGHLGVARTSQRMGYMALHFAFEYLAGARDPEVAGQLLLNAREWWTEHPGTRSGLLRWLDAVRAAGIAPRLPRSADDGWEIDERRSVLRQCPHPVIDEFLAHLDDADRLRRGQREIERVGRLLPEQESLPVARVGATDALVDALVELLLRAGRPSAVLVGSEGCGKTTLAHAALRRLVAAGWRVVEATPAQLVAGQKYIGELEQRVENFAQGLSGDRVLWFVPHCHQLLDAGASSGNPRGLLDLLLPHLERGRIQLLGESLPAAWAQVLSQRPQVEPLVQGIRIDPLADADALALVLDWGRRWSARLDAEVLDADVAVEAAALARQQYPERAEPGRTLSLLKEALADALRRDPPSLPLDRDQLLQALARSSGLPLEILDGGRPLDIAQVRSGFRAAVIGQDEAVDCLVDRISMLKAGLNDPRRPIGVFLFAGPTGTGKTELVKTLARYLFGDAERMLRFDMSEFQSEDAYWRLIDDGRDGRTRSLTSLVRQHPFSVVLLDEFEKAHPRIWDLFLQVFDDGRLTDRAGNPADFRHSIIVLTSNLGSTVRSDDGLGFVSRRGGFDRGQVERAIRQSFRPEFINRLDRVVVFNPLTRALMREILGKELRAVLGRRGFRSRDWAVEWEPSAIEFLLDRGFTPDLGARPLRRAIEQHLLAPLARTMVEHRVPAGEQFLFVHGDGEQLRVRFVDPDASDADATPADGGAAPDLRSLALDPRADGAALEALARAVDELEARRDGSAWQQLKEHAARAMQAEGFWQRDERRSVLDLLERVDRIEDGLRTMRSLLVRLSRGSGRGAALPVRRAALQLLVLRAAIESVLQEEPEDARVELRPADPHGAAALAWRDRLAQMYLRWAAGRGLRAIQAAGDREHAAIVLRISGGAAFRLLLAESGVHVLDTHAGREESRSSVRVVVDSDPPRGLAAADTGRICRRYDDGPSPLVRDLVRGWRSGRLDRVLAGDFDLIGG